MITPHEREVISKQAAEIGISVYKEGRALDIDMRFFHWAFDQKDTVNLSPLKEFFRWFFFGKLWNKTKNVDQLNPDGEEIHDELGNNIL